jgi:Flp pilus assembly pilin Flp
MYERISLKVGELFTGLQREEGQGATEYAMVIGFLVVGLTIGLGVLGVGIDAFLGRVAGALDGLVP